MLLIYINTGQTRQLMMALILINVAEDGTVGAVNNDQLTMWKKHM